MLRRLIEILSGTGGRQPSENPGMREAQPSASDAGPTLAPEDSVGDEDDSLPHYGSFLIRDGHELASRLQQAGIPFEVDFDDGIRDVNLRTGSGGSRARMEIYVGEEHWEVMDALVLELAG